MTTEEDVLIQKVLADKKTKRKRSSDDDENTDLTDIVTTTETDAQPLPIDEHDLKWAANYIEEQQTQLILSLFNDDGTKSTTNKDDEDDDDDDDDDHEQQNKEDDYKSFRPSLETMGISKLFINE